MVNTGIRLHAGMDYATELEVPYRLGLYKVVVAAYEASLLDALFFQLANAAMTLTMSFALIFRSCLTAINLNDDVWAVWSQTTVLCYTEDGTGRRKILKKKVPWEEKVFNILN